MNNNNNNIYAGVVIILLIVMEYILKIDLMKAVIIPMLVGDLFKNYFLNNNIKEQ